MDVNMETIGCQVWIKVPVCPEQLVALPESVVEKHIDPFEGQLCVVDGLRLRLLQAPRRSVGWGRHWDTLQGGTGGGGGELGWGGGRAEREATLLKCTSVAACDAVFCSKRGHVHNIVSAC